MVWIEKDLRGHLIPTPRSWTGIPSTWSAFLGPHPACSWTLPGMKHLQPLWATSSEAVLWVCGRKLTHSVTVCDSHWVDVPRRVYSCLIVWPPIHGKKGNDWQPGGRNTYIAVKVTIQRKKNVSKKVDHLILFMVGSKEGLQWVTINSSCHL